MICRLTIELPSLCLTKHELQLILYYTILYCITSYFYFTTYLQFI